MEERRGEERRGREEKGFKGRLIGERGEIEMGGSEILINP